MSTLRLAFYGDDFTGSTDALAVLAGAGLRSVLFISPPDAAQLARFGELDAVGVAGLSRSMAPATMEAALRPAFTALRVLGPRHVHYKVCSTFDSSPTVGSIGRALEIGAEVFGGRGVPLFVAAPDLGRHCIFGNLFARFGIGSAGEIHRLDRHPAMLRHPTTPADESDLRLHLAKQTARPCGLLDVLTLDGSDAAVRDRFAALVAGGAEIVLIDALTHAHLPRVGALLEWGAAPGRSLFSVGSSGVEAALTAHWAERGEIPAPPAWPRVTEAAPLLVASGSCSPVTAGQIAWARAQGFVEVPLDAATILCGEWPAAAESALIDALRAGRPTMLHTTAHGRPDAALAGVATAQPLGCALGRLVRAALAQVPLTRVLLAGGDSSSHAAHALGIQALEMAAPFAPGAPLCRAHAPNSPADGREFLFKGGQVGAEDFFGAVARGRL